MPHPGIVQHQKIAGTQQFGEVGKPPVCQTSLPTGQHEKPGRIPRLHGVLGDELFRQFVVISRCGKKPGMLLSALQRERQGFCHHVAPVSCLSQIINK